MVRRDNYRVADPESLETPAMVLFRDSLEHNLRSVCELVDGGENLVVHVKTHKSEDIARRQLDHGIAGFKCATLKELEMVLRAGARKAILAYPQVQKRKVERLFDLAGRYPDAKIAALVSSPLHYELLAATADSCQQTQHVMLDVDAGQHRTGIQFGVDAIELYKQVANHPLLEPAGIHWYDGHDNYVDEDERQARAESHIASLREIRSQLERRLLGDVVDVRLVDQPDVVVSGHGTGKISASRGCGEGFG